MTISKELIEEKISDEKYHQFEGTNTIVCAIILKSGFVSVGESACVHQEDFSEYVGKKVARQKAFDKVFSHEAYRELDPKRVAVRPKKKSQRVVTPPNH